MTNFRPENPEQLREAVAWAAAEGAPLELSGSASLRALGRPVQAEHAIRLDGFSGISLYEPDELVMSAGAGTPRAEVEAALAESRQQLEFEPPDYAKLLGGGEASGTIGGIFACNLAGPRRVKSGAARDHFLGFHAVSGRGEIFKSGGRVVKNVTGYDLAKLLAGSWGTLAAMTEVTYKVLPIPEKTRTVLVFGPDAENGAGALSQALQSPNEVSGAAWLPAGLAAQSGVEYVADAGAAVAAIRVEGPGPSVEHRCEALRELLGGFGETEELHSANSATFWREVRDVSCFAGDGDTRVVWKISVPPTSGAGVAGRFGNIKGADAFLDWGGGLVWLALPVGGDADHEAVRAAVADSGGHATLIRAPESVRAAVPVFQPQADGIAALTKRVKESFDPRRILNPGRMYADI